MNNSEREKFEAIFYGAESPLVIFKGPEFIIEMCNEKYQAIYPGRVLLGQALFSAIPELNDSPFPALLKQVYESGKYFVSHEGLARIHNVHTEQLEERYFDTTFSRIKYGDETTYRIIATPREVTDRVSARMQLESTIAKLEHEREFREKLMSAITHDIRGPLSVIKMTAALLNKKADNPQSVKELSKQMTTSLDRADRMICDLLDANRIEDGGGLIILVGPCRLEVVVANAILDLEMMYGEKIVILNEVGQVEGYWDAMSIQRIIENLVSNAFKYRTPNTEVTVSLKSENDSVELAIHNIGEAIPLEDQKDLFQRYHRSKLAVSSGQKGWGLGLTIVKGIVEAHMGSVGVKSDSVEGTTFFVRLPLDARR